MRIVRNVSPPPPPDRFGWPLLALLPIGPEDVPDAEWESYVEEGLGDARGACVEVEGGFVFGLVRYTFRSVPGLDAVAFVPKERLPEALDALLRATGLTRADLPWVTDDVPGRPVDGPLRARLAWRRRLDSRGNDAHSAPSRRRGSAARPGHARAIARGCLERGRER